MKAILNLKFEHKFDLVKSELTKIAQKLLIFRNKKYKGKSITSTTNGISFCLYQNT